MLKLFADVPVAPMAVAVVLVFVGLFGTVFLGRAVRKGAQANGGTTSGGYLLKITLIMAVGLACLFGGIYLLTSYR